jgi:hypothetical protein
MKTHLLSLVFLACNASTFACSIWCSLPAKIDDKTYIGEGIVIGHSGDYTGKDIHGGFGIIQVEVTRLEHPAVRVDTLFLSPFGLSATCATLGTPAVHLRSRYPIDTRMSFIGTRSDLFQDSILHLAVHTCHAIFHGWMSERSRYDYQMQRTSPAPEERANEILDRLSENEDLMWDRRNHRELHNFIGNTLQDIFVAQKYQVYLDILEINRTRSKKVKYYLLQQLIWSSYADEAFLKDQPISKKKRNLLMEENRRIEERWERRF